MTKLNEDTPLVQATETQPQSRLGSKPVRLGIAAVWSLAVLALAAFGLPSSANASAACQDAASPPRHESFCDPTAKHDIGYIKLPNKVDTHYFFWYFESRSAHPETDPLVLWLSGGASSIYAALAENGPCHVNPDLTTEPNEYAWNTYANVIWLDQPTNQGFSYGPSEDTVHNSTEAAENVYWFLREFLEKKHPELQGREFFIAGESYGGHYVPTTAHNIWKKNQALSDNSSSAFINLQGIAIGNGMVNPVIQYAHIPDMVDNAYNISILSDSQAQTMRAGAPECVNLTRSCEDTFVAEGDMSTCLEAQSCWNETLYAPFLASKRNMYDIRRPCETPVVCYDVSSEVSFLNLDSVYDLMGVNREHVPSWAMQSSTVTQLFIESGDWSFRFNEYVADLLNTDLRVLIYAGDADLMCNWAGNDAWTKALEWKGKDGFNAAEERGFWDSKAAPAVGSVASGGSLRKFENFGFLRVFNAGHMVPMDQPELSLAMLSRFLKNEL